MLTVYLIKGFGVETLAVALAFIKCCWVAKCVKKLFYEISFDTIIFAKRLAVKILLGTQKPSFCQVKLQLNHLFCTHYQH